MKRVREKLDALKLGFDAHTANILQAEIDEILSFRPLIPVLFEDLKNFEQQVSEAYNANEFLDTKLASRLIDAARALLSYAQANPWDDAVPFILAAIRYLIRVHDGRNDFDSLDGFEDDRRVITAVIDKFNLHHVFKFEESA